MNLAQLLFSCLFVSRVGLNLCLTNQIRICRVPRGNFYFHNHSYMLFEVCTTLFSKNVPNFFDSAYNFGEKYEANEDPFVTTRRVAIRSLFPNSCLYFGQYGRQGCCRTKFKPVTKYTDQLLYI